MAAVRVSRYEFASPYRDEQGRIFLDVPDPLPKSVLLRGASRRVVVESDTLWSIAWAAYESLLDREQDIRPTSFFDVVGDANDIVDPTALLPAGATFFVPSIEVLLGDVRVPPPFSGTNRLGA